MKKRLFLRFLRSLLITYLISSNLKKEIIALEKSVEKVLNFGSKNLYEPCAPVPLLGVLLKEKQNDYLTQF